MNAKIVVEITPAGRTFQQLDQKTKETLAKNHSSIVSTLENIANDRFLSVDSTLSPDTLDRLKQLLERGLIVIKLDR